MFTNLQFTPGKETPPDTIPSKCWEKDPELCTGIALFDMLIGNDDRRSDHIAVDNKENPKEFILFDHDCAVASDLLDYAKERFKNKLEDFLAENHCLISEITTDEYFPDWIGKIQSIPHWFIEDVCFSVRTKGFDKNTAKAATKFLSWRSRHIDSLIKKHRDQFTSIQHWERII